MIVTEGCIAESRLDRGVRKSVKRILGNGSDPDLAGIEDTNLDFVRASEPLAREMQAVASNRELLSVHTKWYAGSQSGFVLLAATASGRRAASG